MSANYREILRMSADGSYSIREIKAHAHCSYDTIRETLDAARAKGISWPLADDVTKVSLLARYLRLSRSFLKYSL